MPADNTVKAETALREFVQTLTKTFAHLPIGLAIFDRQRQLALFNPALIDLTTLGPEFLSSRPTLFSFLDNLREARMIPEPRDYPTWRQTMTELEKAASQGHYEEDLDPSDRPDIQDHRPPAPGWSRRLPVRGYYRRNLADAAVPVGTGIGSGHPGPDARSDCRLFCGRTIMQIQAACGASGHRPQSALGEVGIADLSGIWRRRCPLPSPIWAEARDFVGGTNSRAELVDDITMKDGRRVAARFVPITEKAGRWPASGSQRTTAQRHRSGARFRGIR